MLKYLRISEELYFASELVINDILSRICIIRYISVSIKLRHGTSWSSTFSFFSQDLEGS